MFKPAMFALAMMLAAPVIVQAAEITLIPAVKLQIGDQDNRGYYWDGGNWRDHGWWNNHYEWRDNRWHAHTPPHHDNGHHNGHHDDHHDNHGHGNDHRDDHRPPSGHH